jgi:hypothetical protein
MATHISTNHNPFIFRDFSQDSFTLKKKAVPSFEISVTTYQLTKRNNPT